MAAAYLACRMKEVGGRDFVDRRIAKLGGFVYRGLRLASSQRMKKSAQDKWLADLKRYNLEHPIAKMDEYDFLVTVEVTRDGDRVTPEAFKRLSPKDLEIGKSRVAEADAYLILMDQVTSQLSINPTTSSPWSMLKSVGKLKKIRKNIESGAMPLKHEGLSEERYELARQKLLTFLIDWEWTTAQHEVGADFGLSVCKKKNDHYSIEEAACRALPPSSPDTAGKKGGQAESGGVQ
jgi:hypothetical protein